MEKIEPKLAKKKTEAQKDEKLRELSEEIKPPIALINETHALEGGNFVSVDGANTQAATAVFVDDSELNPKTPEKAQPLNETKEELINQPKRRSDKTLDEKNIFVHKLLEQQERLLEKNNTEMEKSDSNEFELKKNPRVTDKEAKSEENAIDSKNDLKKVDENLEKNEKE